MRLRSFIRWSGVALAGIILLAVIGVALLHTPSARRIALERVREALEAQGLSLQLEDLRYNLLSFRIAAGKLAIRSTVTPDLPEFLSADGLTIHLSLLNLMRGKYEIDEATLTNLRLHLVTSEDGRTNLPSSKQTETDSTQWFVHQLTSKAASLSYEDRQLGIAFDIPSVDIDIHGNSLTRSQEIHLTTLQEGLLTYGDRRLPLSGEAKLSLTSNNQTLDIQSARLLSDASAVEVKGRIEPLLDPVLDLALSGNVQLLRMREFLLIEQRMEGDVRLDATVKGRPANLQLAGNISGEELVLDRFDHVNAEADIAYDTAARRVTIVAASIQSPLLTAKAHGNLATAEGAGQSIFTAEVDSANLGEVSRTLKLPVLIASGVRGSINVRWMRLDFSDISGSGQLQLSAHRTSNARQLPLGGSVRFIASRGNASITAQPLVAGETVIEGTVTLQQLKTLGGNLRIHTSNAEATLRRVAALSGTTFPETLRITGSIDGMVGLAGTVSQPQIAAEVEAAGLDINELKQLTVQAKANVTTSRIDLASASLTWREQSATVAGHVEFKGPNPTLQFQAHIPRGSVTQVLAAAGRSDIPATGFFDASAEISGTIRNPIGMLRVSASELKAYGETLGNLNAEANIEDQVVYLTNLVLQKAEGRVSSTGQYDLRSKVYRVAAEGSNYVINSLTIPGQNEPASGRLDFTASSNGSFENPAATIRLTVNDADFNHNKLETAVIDGTLSDHQLQVAAKIDTDLAGLEAATSREFAGRLLSTMSLSGDIRHLENARMRAEIPNLQLVWRNRRITSDKPFTLEYVNRVLTVSDATLRMADSDVHISGSLPFDATASGEIKIDAQGDLAGIANILPSETGISAEGRAVLKGVLRGNLKRLEPDAVIQILEAAIETPALPAPILNLNADAVVKDGRLTINKLSTDWAVAKISSTGSLPLSLLLPSGLPLEIPSASGNAELAADVQELRITTLPGMPDALDGTVSGHAEVSAARLNLNSVQGRIELPQLRINVRAYQLEQVGTSVISVRNSVATVEHFELTGPRTTIKVAGSAALNPQGPVDLSVNGTADAAIVSLFSDEVRALGDVSMQVALSGTRETPQLNGFLELFSATAAIDDPAIAVEALNVRLDLNGDQIQLTRLEGLLNGGDIEGKGNVSIGKGTPTVGQAEITVEGAYLEFPEGLRTLSNAKLNLTGSSQQFTIGGTVDVINGSYAAPFAIERGILRYMSTPDRPAAQSFTASPALARIRLDVALKTSSPVVIDNDTARANITADLELKGTAAQPGLTGQIDIEEGAELRLRERRYVLERGGVRFTNEQAIEPILDIAANTRVTTSAATYEITMQIQGNVAERLETTFSSTPTLPEADIISVLATGRTRDQLNASAAEIAQEQVLSYLAGAVGAGISQEVGRAIGLSQVRIEPSLIANEASPTARLTLGQDFTPQLSLIYSMDLRNSNDQIWIGRYNVTRRFTTEALRQSDASYRLQFQHDMLFGGVPAPSRMPVSQDARTVGTVTFSGTQHFTNEQLQKAFKVQSGNVYDFFKVRDGLDNIEDLFRSEGYLEAHAFFDRKERGSTIDVNIRVREGTKVDLAYEGWNVSKGLNKDIIEAWQHGTLDAQRLNDAMSLIREDLLKDNYLSPTIQTTSETPTEGAKRFTFKIDPGMRYSATDVVFEDLNQFPAADLLTILKTEGYLDRDLKEMDQAVPRLQRALAESGFLDAVVLPPKLNLDAEAGTARVAFKVIEGMQYHFHDARLSGNAAFTVQQLQQKISVQPGMAYRLEDIRRTQSELLKSYRDAGYNDVAVDYAEIKDEAAAVVQVMFNIREGEERVLVDVQIEGNDQTSINLLRTQLGLSIGSPVSTTQLSKARNNLYATGAYSLVDIDVVPVPEDFPLPQGIDRRTKNPVRLVARVREVQPYQFRYGGFYDTERGPGGVADFYIRNRFGSARVVGLHTRYDSDLREARLHFSQPTLLRFPVKSAAATFFRRERVEETITNRKGATANLEYRLHDQYIATFGYRIEQTHTFGVIPDTFSPEENLRVAPLTTSLTRDTRNNPLDASMGLFTSHTLEWATARLGSQSRYIKYFGQYFQYHPFGELNFVPWAKEFRNRYVVAWGVRLGVGKGLGGGNVPRSERFLAGGATTIRGFEQNLLGPLDADRQPLGGDAMVVLNGEFRFPLYKFFDGVAFVDAGNVFARAADFRAADLRFTSGIGLRLRTPYVLIRVDYGMKMNRRPDESRGKFFFSIGQAF